jgi:CRP-like cAMP-binding protein
MAKPGVARNHLLSRLSKSEFSRLEPHLQPNEMQVRQEIQISGNSDPYAYFPIDGVISLVTTMEDGSTVEAATVGNEGMVGLPMSLSNAGDGLEAFVQIPGRALRIRSSVLRSAVQRSSDFKRLLDEYMIVLLNFMARSGACNLRHSLRERCAKWLLLAHDRVTGDAFMLTQEFLADMLGVRRATVTEAAGLLRQDKLIDYHVGRIQVMDRKGLESAACECYGIIREGFDRLGAPAPA